MTVQLTKILRRVLERKLRNGSVSEVLGKHEDSGVIPRTPVKVLGAIFCICNPSVEVVESGSLLRPNILSPSERLFLKSR